jgi:hypothetical protein
VRSVTFVRTSRFYLLTGLLALFAFGGDIVADAVADACGDHCLSQNSASDAGHEKTPCSHCSCAVHNGFAVASTTTLNLTGASEGSLFIFADSQSAPPGLPAAIDHPPQLA